MPNEAFEVVTVVRAQPEQVYGAWLDGKKHSAFTGVRAQIEPVIGAPFSAWDEYIVGRNVELVPGHRIVQEWRTTEFPQGAPHLGSS